MYEVHLPRCSHSQQLVLKFLCFKKQSLMGKLRGRSHGDDHKCTSLPLPHYPFGPKYNLWMYCTTSVYHHCLKIHPSLLYGNKQMLLKLMVSSWNSLRPFERSKGLVTVNVQVGSFTKICLFHKKNQTTQIRVLVLSVVFTENYVLTHLFLEKPQHDLISCSLHPEGMHLIS